MKGKNPPNRSLKATKVKRLSSRQTKVHDGYLMLLLKKYQGSVLDRNAIAQIDARLCLDL